MRKILLYGNNEFAKLMKYYIETDTNRNIEGIVVEKKYIKEDSFEGLPVIPFEECEERYPINEFDILICIGYSQMNNVRKKIFCECKQKGYKIASYLHSSSKIANNAILGEGNIILEDTLIQPFSVIGDGNLIWHKVSIAHDCHIGNFNTITGMTSISGIVKIGNNCFFGTNSTIKDKININDYTLIGANAYISKDTDEFSVYVPEKSIKLEKNSLDIVI